MRSTATLLALLFLTTLGSLAQRPWIRAADLEIGSSDRMRIVSNALHRFGFRATRSFDQGVTWDTVQSLPGNVVGMATFKTANISIAIAQPVQPGPVYTYFTQSGTSWTAFDTLDVGNDLAIDLETIGDTYIVGLNSDRLVVRGDDVRMITITEVTGARILDVATDPAAIVVSTTQGVLLSTDLGQSWHRADPDLESPSSVTAFPLRTINDLIHAATTEGVFTLAAESKTWSRIGNWPDDFQNPVVVDLAGDESRTIAMTVRNDTAQLFSMQSGQWQWVETAYPLPGSGPTFSANSLALDAGWAVVAYRSTNEPDSSAIYHFNLNDFTSVHETRDDARVKTSLRSGELVIEHPWSTAVADIFDLNGRLLATHQLPHSMTRRTLDEGLPRILVVRVHDPAGKGQAVRLLTR
jgi:hypothetical protein